MVLLAQVAQAVRMPPEVPASTEQARTARTARVWVAPMLAASLVQLARV
jgi:hypothetical protein